MKDSTSKGKVFKLLNRNYLKGSLGDILSNSPYYMIQEEEGTYLKFKRTTISFQGTHSSEPWRWVCPEIDKIDFIDFYSEKKFLFTSLIERGYCI